MPINATVLECTCRHLKQKYPDLFNDLKLKKYIQLNGIVSNLTDLFTVQSTQPSEATIKISSSVKWI